LLNPSTLTWTLTGAGKADANSEEGWSLLPDGELLTVDASNAHVPTNTELYDPTTGTWSSAGTTPTSLIAGEEVGPQLLRPNGTVFAAGATASTAVYDTAGGTWSGGPAFPVLAKGQYAVADGPSAVLPDGNVLVMASPPFKTHSHFFVFDGTNLTQVTDAPDAKHLSSYYGRMVVLPTGQVLFNGNHLEIYTDRGAPNALYAPQITGVPTALTPGESYAVSGLQLGGLTQGSAYGDDYQSATNYPLVRITNVATGHVRYARTSGMTSMSVAPGAPSSANFTLPLGIETGPSTLVVVANGIASIPVSVTVGP